MRYLPFQLALAICLFFCGLDGLLAQPVVLQVDATQATGRIFHSTLSFPVEAGPLTLVYPKWFPGTHAPTGPIADLTGLRMAAAGQVVGWKRDPEDMFAFHCTVPGGASELEVTLDFVVPTDRQTAHHPTAASEYSALISWTSLLLYPLGLPVDQILFQPSLRLPEGWQYGTALKTVGNASGMIEFAPVSLYELIDSPVVAGAWFRTIDLDPGSNVPYLMHLAADSEAALQVKPETVTGFQNLLQQELALFGARHFNQYHFLVTLSDPLTGGAVEHHESSDNRPPERMFIDEDIYRYWADTLPHEMVHSWNGKYRRPDGLATKDYQVPGHGDLLWVYEGLTNYLGYVLAVRSGLLSQEDFRDATAWMAAGMDQRPGRSWKPLLDTAAAVSATIDASSEWESWRRARDYYNEGTLIWLEADTLIRQETGGRASLDDFCRIFFGGTSGPPGVVPYTLQEIVAALNQILPYDWNGFFAGRVDQVNLRAPVGGIEQAGWSLVFRDTATPYHVSAQKVDKVIDLRFSLGIILNDEALIVDVLPGSAAAEAGIAPGLI
ncbi:MAG: hypothetical protein ACREO9_02170, partial [Lysobacterales bacterium]